KLKNKSAPCKPMLTKKAPIHQSGRDADTRNMAIWEEEYDQLKSCLIGTSLETVIRLPVRSGNSSVMSTTNFQAKTIITALADGTGTILSEKRFACDWSGCDYTTKFSHDLKGHRRTHTGEKPYKCEHIVNDTICSKSFSSARDLKRHS